MAQHPRGTDALTRRHALLRSATGAMALLSAGGLLSACAGGSRRRAAASTGDLPEVRWPEGRLADLSLPRQKAAPEPADIRIPGDTPGGVISRASWARGGVVPSLMDRAQPYYRITIHHDGMTAFNSTSVAAARRRLDQIRAARERETVTFAGLVGGPANQAAIAAFQKKS